MKQANYKKGRKGEDIAEKFLRGRGFQVIEKNFSTRFGEIDLIATKDMVLRFVEVKLKVGGGFGAPEEMINRRKIVQVMKTGEAYLQRNKALGERFPRTQVDAVCIVLGENGEEERVDYYENLTSEL